MTSTQQAASPTSQSTASSIEPIVYSSSNSVSGNIAAIVGCILRVLLVLVVFCIGRRGQPGPRGPRPRWSTRSTRGTRGSGGSRSTRRTRRARSTWPRWSSRGRSSKTQGGNNLWLNSSFQRVTLYLL
jgi:hypothetical protein